MRTADAQQPNNHAHGRALFSTQHRRSTIYLTRAMEGEGSVSVGNNDGAMSAAGQQQSPSRSSPSSSSSVEALLSVPLGLILRELPTPASAAAAAGVSTRRSRRRTLLSRSEATTLLRVMQLSIEQDVLVQLGADVLANAHMCSTLRRRIEESCRALYGGDAAGETGPSVRYAYPRHLLALLPILSIHADSIPDQTVKHVQAESQRILTELAQCAATLRQCAEHNWTVSEHLLVDVGDAAMEGAAGGGATPGGTAGSNVGRDKESLAEIEEAVCDRIEGLIGMAVDTSNSSTGSSNHNADVGSPAGGRKRKRGEGAHGAIPRDVFDISVDYTTGEFVSMEELCQRLFADLKGEMVQEAEKNAAGGENNTTAGDEAAAATEEKAGASSTGVQPMDIDKPPQADNDSLRESSKASSSAPSGANAVGNFASGKNDSGVDNNYKSSDSGAKVAAIDEDDLPRGSSSSSPSQSQVNAATALAVLAST